MADSGDRPGVSRNWSDLAPRVISGVVMLGLGAVLIWTGGHWFRIAMALIAGGMTWELTRMSVPDRGNLAPQMAVIAALASLLAFYLPIYLALPMLLVPSLLAIRLLPSRQVVFLIFTAVILFAAFGMARLRGDFGFTWMLWLVTVVVVTDVAGYFAGRMIGGPKFWPRISPKKTWSGTAAGWIAAAIVGVIFGMVTGSGLGLAGVSIAVSMASQLGDIAESAVKRRAGVKDSSALIPGHGGLMDRFDGMLGGSLFLLLVGPFAGFPPGLV
ncbi:phosphatidate cytidylyltransferase [Pseudooceanicola sp.]|uniref:phosphatidate cytidylyltransferase n=1 Tax=Pseudooceanicola sp. TaxID=1914328 RepID=UPI0026289BF3|nr:phosphatidate cytidylyltransferase [Pseudooceanicola sp.]MDF1855803.1 phosphatidate cytidylyltransferase [Pseudooceanicola sp.]